MKKRTPRHAKRAANTSRASRTPFARAVNLLLALVLCVGLLPAVQVAHAEGEDVQAAPIAQEQAAQEEAQAPDADTAPIQALTTGDEQEGEKATAGAASNDAAAASDEAASNNAAASEDQEAADDTDSTAAPAKAPAKAPAAGELKDKVTRDEVRISSLYIDGIVDGTGPWDENDDPGNDSADNNKIVRSYDTIVYSLHYTTQAATFGDEYKHGWIYCEATLPVAPEVATFNLNAIERGYPTEYTGPQGVVYDEETSTQKLVWFKERVETTNPQGNIIEPLPNEAIFPVTVDVLAATNNTEIKPSFKLSVAYFDEDDDGALKTEGTYDVPKEVTADPVKVSAAPKYNVQIKHHSGSETFNGKIGYWDFSTGNDSSAEYPALYKDKGRVYGKMISMGITLQLYNDNPAKGLKGVEIPKGPIEFDLNMDAEFAGNTVDAPLVWSYGPQMNRKSAQQDGREVNAHVLTGYDYAVYEAPGNKNGSAAWRAANPDAASPTSGNNGTHNCWDGGTWHMSASGNKVHVTVEDYNINMNWFPNGDLGYSSPNATYFNYLNGVQNIGCFSAGQVFLIVPFGGEPGTPEYYPNKYNADGNVMLNITDDGFNATSISGQQVNNAAQMATTDDLINNNILLTRPGTRVNRVYYQNLDGYGTNAERGINGTYATFQEGSDVATLGQEISTCWGILIDPNGSESQSAYAQNALLKFDPTVMEPTGEFTTNGPFTNTRYPEPGETTFLYGFKPDGSAWSSVDEMDEATEQDLVFYSSPNGHGECVALLAEAREYPQTAQREVITFSAKFKVKEDSNLAWKTYALTSGSYVWTKAEVEENGGSIPTRADGASYAVTVTPSYETYSFSTKIRESGQDVNFRKAYYDEQGYHGENGNYIYGDTLYIVEYTTKIQKNVEQANGPNNPKPVVSFSLSNQQSIVDYVLKPDFEIPNLSGPDFTGRTTTLTVSDILPAGLTYRAGSAYLGGRWTEHSDLPNRTDEAYLHGSIEGGTQREPDYVTYNEDGTTTLTWEFPNTPIKTLDQDMWIHFSANLPQAISKTTSYVNTAVVSSTEDRRKQESVNGNWNTATIQVSPASDLVSTKQVDEPLVDTESPIGFSLRWNNTAPGGSFNNVMMDTMPSTTKNGSKFSGTYTVEGPITITPPSGKTNADYTFYYTTDAAASDQQASDYQADYVAGRFTGNTVSLQGVTWTKAYISAANANGECEVADVANKPITAFIILGRMDRLEELSAHVTIEPSGNKPGDVYVNAISSNLLTSAADAHVVSRALSGTVWVDADRDGERQEGEERVAGVSVALKVKQGESLVAAKDANGADYVATTDAQGNYEFTGLAAGEYVVEFTNNGKKLGTYKATVKNAEGVAASVNSDAEPKYENDLFADISGIEMPAAKDMRTTPYVVRHQDLGIYRPDLTIGKTVDVSALDAAEGADEDAAAAAEAAKAAELSKEFLFKVTVADAEEGVDYKLVKISGGTEEDAGTVSGADLKAGHVIKLKDGEKITVKALPVGASYKVEEYDYTSFGYTSAVETGDGLSTAEGKLEADTDTTDADKAVSFKNTYAPETVDVKFAKKWTDESAEDVDGYTRPESVEVTLVKDGTATTQKATLNAGSSWEGSFTGLDKYDVDAATWPTAWDSEAAAEIKYTLSETLVGGDAYTEVSGQKRFYIYSDSVSVKNEGEDFAVLGYFVASDPVKGEDGTYEIENTFTPAAEDLTGTTGFTVLKVDAEGKAITTDSAAFKLVKVVAADDGTETEEEVGTAATSTKDGKASFAGLSAGTYKLTEEAAPKNYVKSTDTYTITISEDGKTLVSVEDKEPKNFFERIFGFGVAPEAAWDDKTLTLSVVNDTYTPVIVNPPIEKKIEGEDASVDLSGTATDEFTFTFKPVSNTAGIAAADMPMPEGSENGIKQITKPGAGEYEFGEFALPLPGTYVYQMAEESGDLDYDYDDSTYTVTYVVTAGADGKTLAAETTITKDGEAATDADAADSSADTKAVFTNMKKAEPKISIQVSKVWDDKDDADKLRPASVDVALLADGQATGKTLTLNEANSWKGTFEDLPEADADGKTIAYMVDEPNVPEGYTKSISGTTITNTHEPKASDDPKEEDPKPEDPTPGGGDDPAPRPWVTYVDPDGNTVYLERTGFDGDEPAAPPAPTREGYIFDGWDRTVDEDGNITYIARWRQVNTPAPDPEPDPDPAPAPQPTPTPQPRAAASTQTPAATSAPAATPKTADPTPIGILATLALASAAVFMTALGARRRSKEEDEA